MQASLRICIQCGNGLLNRNSKYCSNKCQADRQYHDYIAAWKNGKRTGIRGTNTQAPSRHIIRFLREKYDDKCSLCDWNEINVVTNSVPLEIDHIDGNHLNNAENNLRLLCPNCHSLTPNFRNLNKGKGRQWRKNRYIRVQ